MRPGSGVESRSQWNSIDKQGRRKASTRREENDEPTFDFGIQIMFTLTSTLIMIFKDTSFSVSRFPSHNVRVKEMARDRQKDRQTDQEPSTSPVQLNSLKIEIDVCPFFIQKCLKLFLLNLKPQTSNLGPRALRKPNFNVWLSVRPSTPYDSAELLTNRPSPTCRLDWTD